MRGLNLFATSLALLLLVRPAMSNDEPDAQSGAQPKKAGLSVSSTGDNRSSGQTSADRKRVARPSPEEEAIRKTGETYVVAFSEGDAKSAARHFSTDAEYVDAQGIVYEGRQAIEDLLTAFFANHPGCKLQLAIDSLRFISPGVAVEDGVTTLTTSKDSEPTVFQYTAVHVKDGGKWLTASVRDRAVASPRQHRAQLKQLDWMVGEWVHEGPDAVVRFSCQPVDKGNFLVRKFSVQVAGQEAMSGTQRIGWDAQSGKFRAWVFDSDGGYSDGCWHRDEDHWVLKMTGVTPDGASASNTSIYSFVDARTMTFRSIDHEVAGVKLPDSEPVTIVRQPPPAEAIE